MRLGTREPGIELADAGERVAHQGDRVDAQVVAGPMRGNALRLDLDLAIKEQREEFSGARGKAGLRAFMTGVLLSCYAKPTNERNDKSHWTREGTIPLSAFSLCTW